jgi:hypothetical protein
MKIPTACLRVVPILLVLSPIACLGQQPAAQKLKLPPASLSPEPMILDESVVVGQWPKMLEKVNVPMSLQDLSPGQCVRVGVIATGENAAGFLKEPQIGFTVHLGGHDTDVPLASAIALKQIKPDGADFVQGALDAGGVKFQVPATAAIAASPGKWCVPADAQAGEAHIEAVVLIGAKRTSLKAAKIAVLSPEHPGQPPLSDDKAMNDWSQSYYRHPQPVFLVALLPSIFTHDKAANILQQFVISAMKRDPAVVARLGPQLATAGPQVQAMAVKLAAEAGVEMKVPFELSSMQKEFVEKLPNIPDAFDLTPDRALFGKQDQLWAIFTATGDRAPVDALISMLAWHADYDAFQKMQAEHQKITEVTPQLARGLAYASAGWSLGSFQRSDPLVADYILAALADARTPESIKQELRGLVTNPAFKH